MYRHKAPTHNAQPSFTIKRSALQRIPPLLHNLLADTSPPVLVALSERYGLPRVPGLNRHALIDRLLRHLSAAELNRLADDLIAARFGGLSTEALLAAALEHDARRAASRGSQVRPRMDQVSPDDAVLLERRGRRWSYTMRGHDVTIDLEARTLACDCQFFSFAARRHALCKHIAMAFSLIPVTYARDALIDLLVWREYGTVEMPGWRFISSQ